MYLVAPMDDDDVKECKWRTIATRLGGHRKSAALAIADDLVITADCEEKLLENLQRMERGVDAKNQVLLQNREERQNLHGRDEY